jgi:hypothetical protein
MAGLVPAIHVLLEHRSAFVEGSSKRYALKRAARFVALSDIRMRFNASKTSTIGDGRGRSGMIVAVNPALNDLFDIIAK